ncbi:MAG: hypothetical protein MJ206_00110 [Bacilli bacterium]|nr:hypothetical protein [Bacilli bacterium]
MKPLIYAKKNSHNDEAYEENRLRKSIKGALEAVNVPYETSVFADFDLVHFVNDEDLNKVNEVKFAGYPAVVSALYCETEKQSQMVHLTENRQVLKGKYRRCLNAANLVLVPGIHAKEFLEKSGVKSPIKVFPSPVNFKRFSDETRKKIAPLFKAYFEQSNQDPFILCVGDYKNKVEMQNLLEIAELCSFTQFYFIGANYSNVLRRKYITEGPDNIIFSSLIPEQIFRSTLMHSKIFLLLDSRRIETIHVMEAMAAKTQVILFNDKRGKTSYLKDKINCYIARGTYDVATLIEKYLKGRLKPTITKAYQFVKDNYNLETSGKQLVKLYEGLLK